VCARHLQVTTVKSGSANREVANRGIVPLQQSG